MEQLRRDGVALAYEEAGSGAPPIVLVHDLASDHTCFAPQFERFSRRHRVVATDLRGHGESDKPAGPNTVSLLADDLAWLCYELGLYRPVVLGHGLGASVALDLAARYHDLPVAIVAVAPSTVSSPTLPRHVAAPLPENSSNWDHVGATRECSVPVLHVASHAGDAALPEEISAMVEGFLSRLAGRAPP